MLMIDKNKKNEIVINKSRFINYLIVINGIDEVEKNLEEIKDEYKDATHYCYAYIFDNIKRFNDNGEPGGTAGVPMLNVLESHNLNHILAVTVRYFGGIKLGAGGLVRAYTKSVTENLKDLSISEYVDGYNFSISFPYDLKEIFESKLKEYIQSKSYSDSINYSICVKKEDFDEIKSLCDKYNIELKDLNKLRIKK